MMRRVLLAAGAVAACGWIGLAGQEPAPAVFTEAQAAAGRTAYRSSCGKCHTDTLMGRIGDPGELPPVDSLPAAMQEVVRGAGGNVPPLAGVDFMKRWGARTTRDLSMRIRDAVGGFPPRETGKETYLELTAYILQANGARAGTQALDATSAVEIRSVTAAHPAH